MVGLMRTSEGKLAPHGVRCNVIRPGFAGSDLTTIRKRGTYAQDILGGTPDDMGGAGRSYGQLTGATYIEGDVSVNAHCSSTRTLPRASQMFLLAESRHTLMPGVNASRPRTADRSRNDRCA